MKRKLSILIIIVVGVSLFALALFLGNILLTDLVEDTNVVCKYQKFSSAEEAMQALETYEREVMDTSLDFCPPYELVHTFDYEDNTVVFYSYCDSFDGEKCDSYAVRILKHNDDNTLSFDSGFAKLNLQEPTGNENYYYFTNINTSEGKKSIIFLYLDKDSDKDIYVDGKRAEKTLVSMDDNEFYLCYAISSPDTFLSNLFSEVVNRHKIEIK